MESQEIISPFTRRAKRRLVTGDKFFFFDAGIYRTLRPVGPLDTPEEINDAALETLLLQEITALNDYFGLDLTIYYWKTSLGAEVDFVIYGKNTFIAIEVKRSHRVKNDLMTGLKLFKYEVLQKVFPRILVKAYGYDLEILVNVHRLGYKIAEAPIVLNFKQRYGRVGPEAIWTTWRDTMAVWYRTYILKYYDRFDYRRSKRG